VGRTRGGKATRIKAVPDSRGLRIAATILLRGSITTPKERSISDSSNSKLLDRIGWGLTGLSVLALLASASMKIVQEAHNIEYVVGRFGYPAKVLVPLGVLELICTLIYALPRTSMLGAVLLTGYLGGAVATHVRISEAFYSPIILGVLVWLGLYSRDPRLRGLLPLRNG
jgi:hypothetical protein